MSTWFIWDVAFLCTLNWNSFWNFINLKINSKCLLKLLNYKVSIPRPILIYGEHEHLFYIFWALCPILYHMPETGCNCVEAQASQLWDIIFLSIKGSAYCLKSTPSLEWSPPPSQNQGGKIMHLLSYCAYRVHIVLILSTQLNVTLWHSMCSKNETVKLHDCYFPGIH